MARYALSEGNRRAVAERYQRGDVSIAALATEYGCSGRAIWLALKDHGVPGRRLGPPAPRYALPPDTRRQVAERYRAGESTPVLAKAFGCSIRAIRSSLKEHGVEGRSGWAVTPESKRCPKCGLDKPADAFARLRTRHGAKALAGYCKRCMAVYAKPWIFKRETGITLEQYDELLAKQGGCCALCRQPPGKNRLQVDHDHETNEIRGLLCSKCNVLLCVAIDNDTWLQRALDYKRSARTGWQYGGGGRKRAAAP